MREKEFRIWMEKSKGYHTARTYTARCIRVESEMKVNLDDEYNTDAGSCLIEKLKYSRAEERAGVIPNCGIKFDDGANVYTGMHSLRASVKKYLEFCVESNK